MLVGTALSATPAAPLPAVGAPAPGSAIAAAPVFVALKGLVGTWRPAGNATSPLRIRFALTAGGTVLVEEWRRAGQPYSLTLYHRDGAGLIATHYCPQGNQPRLGLTGPPDGKVFRFAFRDATDLDPVTEAYLTALTLDLSDDAVLTRREVYRQNGSDTPSELKLVRDRSAGA